MKLRLRALVCVSVWSFCVGITSAQNGGTIRGVVQDPEGNPLPRATVELTGGSAVVRTQTSQTGEYVPNYRQVYLDGRQHPKDLNPSWTGHSIGRWDGNTLVIDTVGFNDKSWIEIFPHTEKLHVIERYTRIDRGHLNIEVLIEDPGAFVRPWRSRATWTLAPRSRGV